MLLETGRLEDGEAGYPDAKTLSGVVVEALGRDGRRLVSRSAVQPGPVPDLTGQHPQVSHGVE
jgi:hypothetical protein